MYYVGMVVSVIGAVLFISVFFSVASAMSRPSTPFAGFGAPSVNGGAVFLRAIIGMVLMVAGHVLRGIGSQGAAGSGLVLDPKQAREDLEPWARMGGGLVKDALDEAEINTKGEPSMPFDEKLRRLAALREDGLLSEDEYQAKRAQVLSEKL